MRANYTALIDYSPTKRKIPHMKGSITAICVVAYILLAPATARETNLAATASGSVLFMRSTEEGSWEGTYSFSEDPGQNAGPGPMIAEHTITIYKRGDMLIADIDADGYQTIRRLRCDAKISGNRISFYFNSYREDNGFATYKKGQLLLALERATIRGRAKTLTYWGVYQPIFRSLKSGRVYFEKRRQKP
jgi:hypothetical protein